MRSVPNYRLDDELQKEYFYHEQDDNNKAVLDTIAGDSYGECPYDEIVKKLEKSPGTIKLRVLESQILGEIPL